MYSRMAAPGDFSDRDLMSAQLGGFIPDAVGEAFAEDSAWKIYPNPSPTRI